MIRFEKLSMVVGNDENEDGISSEVTTPVRVRADVVRNFYPRKPDAYGNPRVGTRITFVDGAGMAVVETPDEVEAALTASQAVA